MGMGVGLQQAAEDTAAIAQAFVTARQAGSALPIYPGVPPTDLDAAYAVQDAAIALTARPVGGWKVGRINPPRDGVDRLAGPIFTDQIVVATDEPVPMPVFGEGFAAAEAEFLLRIGAAPDPAQLSYTQAEAEDLIDAVHIGLEIASSPFVGINDHGPAVTISDFGNNNGLVIGAAVTGWRDAGIRHWPVELDINGAPIGRDTAETMLDGPFGAARFLFEHMAARGVLLTAGQWISTGAVTGVHRVRPGDRVNARFDNNLSISCTIKAR